MSQLKVFVNERFGKVRVVARDGEPWFVGKDVAEALGYANTKDALLAHVDNEDKALLQRSEIAALENHTPRSVLPINFVAGNIPNRGLTIINESGLYALVISSKLPDAKAFKRWVTSEILPSIHKHGAYMTPDALEAALTDPDFAIGLLQNLKDERAKRAVAEAKCVALQNEVEHKENVIIGLVGDIDLATKRQRINQIVWRGGNGERISRRWNLLYSEFERKYHVDLQRRQASSTYADVKPSFKNTMDFIDRGLHMVAETFELACKLFENDVEALKAEWECSIAV